MPLAQSWPVGAYCALRIVVRRLSGGHGRVLVARPRRCIPREPRPGPCAGLLSADRSGLGSHDCSRIRSFGAGAGSLAVAGAGSLAVQDAGRPDPGVLHARGADGVHGDRPVMHVGGGWGASRSGQDSTRGPASACRGSRLRGARVWSRCSASVWGPLVMVSAPCRGNMRHGPMSRRAGPSARRLARCYLPAETRTGAAGPSIRKQAAPGLPGIEVSRVGQ